MNCDQWLHAVSRFSNPLQVFRLDGTMFRHLAGVSRGGGFEQQDVTQFSGHRLVFDASGNDAKLALGEVRIAVQVATDWVTLPCWQAGSSLE